MTNEIQLNEPWKPFVELCFKMDVYDLPPYEELLKLLSNN